MQSELDDYSQRQWIQLPLFGIGEWQRLKDEGRLERIMGRTERELLFDRKQGGWFFPFLAGFFDGHWIPPGHEFESLWVGRSWEGWQVVIRCKRGEDQMSLRYADHNRSKLWRGLQFIVRHGSRDWRKSRPRR